MFTIFSDWSQTFLIFEKIGIFYTLSIFFMKNGTEKLGHQPIVISPMYRQVRESGATLEPTNITLEIINIPSLFI